LLSKECEQLYISCNKEQTEIKAHRFTIYQCTQRLDEIHKTIDIGTYESVLAAANALKELLDEKESEILQMHTADSLTSNINKTKNKLYKRLFFPLINHELL
jgi:hypothetical protein